MSDLVTVRITVDPVLKEQLKLTAIERGMTQGELLPKLLAQGLQSEPNKAVPAPTAVNSANGAVPMAMVTRIEEVHLPELSVQEAVTQHLTEQFSKLSKVLVLLVAGGDKIEQLCNQHQRRFESAVDTIAKRAEQAVENSNMEWQGVMRVRRQNRYWLGGTAAATLFVTWIVLALISGTSLGRSLAVWQAGADTEWHAAQLLAGEGSNLHSEMMAETKAFLDDPEFRSAYAKCVDRAKSAKEAVRCTLVFPGLSIRP